MTLSTTTAKVGYLGNGTTTAFAVPFAFFGAAELEVVERAIVTGVETPRALTTHYTVTGGNGSTGTVTAVAAPPATVTWTIARKTARTQLTDYLTGDAFPAETHERALDRLTALVQEIEEILGRSLRIPITDVGSTPQLPSSTARANKVLVFDAAGQPGVSDAAALATLTATSFVNLQEWTGDGVTTSYTLNNAPGNASAVHVSVGGIVQSPSLNYTVAGNTLTFVSAPPSGQRIIARWVTAGQNVNFSPLRFGVSNINVATVGAEPDAAALTFNQRFVVWNGAGWGWNFDTNGKLSSGGGGAFGRNAIRTSGPSYSVLATDNWILNQAGGGGTLTLTLPAASDALLGRPREIMITNQNASDVVSASADVVPIDGSTPGTAILPATAGAWCVLVALQTGLGQTRWRVMQRGQ